MDKGVGLQAGGSDSLGAPLPGPCEPGRLCVWNVLGYKPTPILSGVCAPIPSLGPTSPLKALPGTPGVRVQGKGAEWGMVGTARAVGIAVGRAIRRALLGHGHKQNNGSRFVPWGGPEGRETKVGVSQPRTLGSHEVASSRGRYLTPASCPSPSGSRARSRWR